MKQIGAAMRGTAIVIALSVFYCGGLLAADVPSGLAVGERADQFLVKDCTGPAAVRRNLSE